MIDAKDNVATALQRIEKDESIRIETEDGVLEVTAAEPIPVGHKIVLKDIAAGEPLIKYGEVIGLASDAIGRGRHAHVHNIEGQKGRGDKA